MKRSHLIVPLALAGACALVTLPALTRADDTVRESVDRLMPQLLSEDDAVRNDAERRLFALGEPARAELERITRDSDPRRAVTALRLLQSRRWADAAKSRDGEQKAEREGGSTDPGSSRDEGLDDMRERMRRELEDLRRRFRDFDRDFRFEWPDMRLDGTPDVHGRSSGEVVENDRRFAWSVDEDGSVHVTTRDGKDASEQKYDAKSLDELRKEHPDVAGRLDKVMPHDGGGFRFRFGPGAGPDERRLEPFRDGQGGRGAAPDVRSLPLGVEWSPVPDLLREQLDLTSGMVVESVYDDTLAKRLGLARHDVLLEVAGKPVGGAADVRAALDPVKTGEKVSVVVLRKGKRTTLEATR